MLSLIFLLGAICAASNGSFASDNAFGSSPRLVRSTKSHDDLRGSGSSGNLAAKPETEENRQTEIRKSRSCSFPKKRAFISPGVSPGSLSPEDEAELNSPLLDLVEPRPPRPGSKRSSPKTTRSRRISQRTSPRRVRSPPPEESVKPEIPPVGPFTKFNGMSATEIKYYLTEKRLQYLASKAHYSRAKLEYYEIKEYLSRNTPSETT